LIDLPITRPAGSEQVFHAVASQMASRNIIATPQIELRRNRNHNRATAAKIARLCAFRGGALSQLIRNRLSGPVAATAKHCDARSPHILEAFFSPKPYTKDRATRKFLCPMRQERQVSSVANLCEGFGLVAARGKWIDAQLHRQFCDLTTLSDHKNMGVVNLFGDVTNAKSISQFAKNDLILWLEPSYQQREDVVGVDLGHDAFVGFRSVRQSVRFTAAVWRYRLRPAALG